MVPKLLAIVACICTFVMGWILGWAWPFRNEVMHTKRRRKKMKCPVCGHELHWDSDIMYEDRGLEGNGIITFLHCVHCGCDIELYQPEENPYMVES